MMGEKCDKWGYRGLYRDEPQGVCAKDLQRRKKRPDENFRRSGGVKPLGQQVNHGLLVRLG
jgi:hypothetical protein